MMFDKIQLSYQYTSALNPKNNVFRTNPKSKHLYVALSNMSKMGRYNRLVGKFCLSESLHTSGSFVTRSTSLAHYNSTEVEPQVPCVRLRGLGRINLNFSTTYAVDCGA